MRNTSKKRRDYGKDVDLGILFDGPMDETETDIQDAPASDTALRRPDSPDTTVPADEHMLEVIQPEHFRIAKDLDHRPGEDAWAYLDRIAPLLLKELIMMATAPAHILNPRVKLDALKELLSRPLPPRTVYDIRSQPSNEFDRMTDSQVMDFVTKQIGEMRKEELAPKPVDPVPPPAKDDNT